MDSSDLINKLISSLEEWSPSLLQTFDRLGLFDPQFVDDMVVQDALAISTSSSTRDVVREHIQDIHRDLHLSEALIVLEHFRRFPSLSASVIQNSLRPFTFSKTLAELSLRVANLLHDSARAAFAKSELDLSIAFFDEAAREFLFALSSGQLSESGERNASGKYAVAIAISGRWLQHDVKTLGRALQWLESSMRLGNVNEQSISYRLELLIQIYDRTGNRKYLDLIRDRQSQYHETEKDFRLLQAETRLRLSLISDEAEAKVFLRVGHRYLEGLETTGIERIRVVILRILLEHAASGELPLDATACSLPNGLSDFMSRHPSEKLWQLIRAITATLQHEIETKKSIHAAVIACQLLRQITQGPSRLSTLRDYENLCEISQWLADRARFDRFFQWEAANAVLTLASKTRNIEDARKAEDLFAKLARIYPAWPLPRVGLATVRERFRVLGGDPNRDWGHAVDLALKATTYLRTNLGGRNEVFAVTDVRGFLRETFVFKPMNPSSAEHERDVLKAMIGYIRENDLGDKYSVPRSISVVETEQLSSTQENQVAIHVSQRATGRLLSELETVEARQYLPAVIDFIAIFHLVGGAPKSGRSSWRPFKAQLKNWSRTVFDEETSLELVDAFRTSMPTTLPPVRKRDAHPSNWIIDNSSRIVAIDFESSEWIFAGLDVVQLLEDGSFLEWDTNGWDERLQLLAHYFEMIGHRFTNSELTYIYSWMALSRALRNATDVNASKASLRNARQTVAEVSRLEIVELGPICRLLGDVLTVSVEEASLSKSRKKDVRLSRAISRLLRHKAPDSGIEMDAQGFVQLSDLADSLKVTELSIRKVVGNPDEPRFEIVENKIRALYGHSLPVEVVPTISIGVPRRLYHGTSWSFLDEIAQHGLKPMGRQRVHLTNSIFEAVAVARRKGLPLVLEILSSGNVTGAAEGIWTSEKVGADRISILSSDYLLQD